jgi:hypothetical protein
VTTKQLATYLIAAIAMFAGLFGVVPPLLNASNTFMNALGASLAFVIIFATILIVHSTYTKPQVPSNTDKE